MLDTVFITEKIDLISRDLKRLEEFRDFTIDEMSKEYLRYAALKNGEKEEPWDSNRR